MKEPDMSTISMVDLDRTLSLSVARARHMPLQVTNRHKPWVWLVSHETWRRERQYLEYIPDNHPLIVLRRLLDQHLADASTAQALRQLARELELRIDAHILCRALCLRAIDAIPDNRTLYQAIGYNMVYRHFVGMDTCMILWPYSDFDRELRSLSTQPGATQLVGFAVEQRRKLPATAGEFRDRGRQEGVAVMQLPQDCDCGLACLPPRLA